MYTLKDIPISNETNRRLWRLAEAAIAAGAGPTLPNGHPATRGSWRDWLVGEAIRRGLRDLENDHAAKALF